MQHHAKYCHNHQHHRPPPPITQVLLAQVREQLIHRLRTQPHVQQADTMRCLTAVHTYQRLAALLRGEQPRGLLPPCPLGYVASRVRTLAQGSCVQGFRWDAGGPWGSRQWSEELPTDSALLLYLFAAFLEAPGWAFTLEDTAASLPLYLGQLPQRPAHGYYAVLASRPPPTPKVCGCICGMLVFVLGAWLAGVGLLGGVGLLWCIQTIQSTKCNPNTLTGIRCIAGPFTGKHRPPIWPCGG